MNEVPLRQDQVEGIRENLSAVERQIASAAQSVGRDAGEVRIVVVSKAQPLERVRAAYFAGIRTFGENRLKEALPKIETLADLPDLEWHMIGHVQSRKAKLLDNNFALLHSVDRIKLARKINALNVQSDNILSVLLECNLSGEQSKWGWQMSDPDAWPSAVDEFSEIAAMETLHLRGLMTMAPLTANQSLLRTTFEKCRQLRDFLAERLGLELPELSMGMSNDFKIAVEQGATLVRIGTAILGPRHSMG